VARHEEDGDAINRRPQGSNPGDLQEFHHFEEAPDVKSRTWVAIVIAIVMAGFGVYVYEKIWNPPVPPSPVLDSQLPNR
jgi:hypothetical protein